jgi:hypothetical protein
MEIKVVMNIFPGPRRTPPVLLAAAGGELIVQLVTRPNILKPYRAPSIRTRNQIGKLSHLRSHR